MPCFFFLSFFLFSSNSCELLQAGLSNRGNAAKTATNAANDESMMGPGMHIEVKPEVRLYVGENREELVTRGKETVGKPLYCC